MYITVKEFIDEIKKFEDYSIDFDCGDIQILYKDEFIAEVDLYNKYRLNVYDLCDAVIEYFNDVEWIKTFDDVYLLCAKLAGTPISLRGKCCYKTTSILKRNDDKENFLYLAKRNDRTILINEEAVTDKWQTTFALDEELPDVFNNLEIEFI